MKELKNNKATHSLISKKREELNDYEKGLTKVRGKDKRQLRRGRRFLDKLTEVINSGTVLEEKDGGFIVSDNSKLGQRNKINLPIGERAIFSRRIDDMFDETQTLGKYSTNSLSGEELKPKPLTKLSGEKPLVKPTEKIDNLNKGTKTNVSRTSQSNKALILSRNKYDWFEDVQNYGRDYLRGDNNKTFNVTGNEIQAKAYENMMNKSFLDKYGTKYHNALKLYKQNGKWQPTPESAQIVEKLYKNQVPYRTNYINALKRRGFNIDKLMEHNKKVSKVYRDLTPRVEIEAKFTQSPKYQKGGGFRVFNKSSKKQIKPPKTQSGSPKNDKSTTLTVPYNQDLLSPTIATAFNLLNKEDVKTNYIQPQRGYIRPAEGLRSGMINSIRRNIQREKEVLSRPTYSDPILNKLGKLMANSQAGQRKDQLNMQNNQLFTQDKAREAQEKSQLMNLNARVEAQNVVMGNQARAQEAVSRVAAKQAAGQSFLDSRADAIMQNKADKRFYGKMFTSLENQRLQNIALDLDKEYKTSLDKLIADKNNTLNTAKSQYMSTLGTQPFDQTAFNTWLSNNAPVNASLKAHDIKIEKLKEDFKTKGESFRNYSNKVRSSVLDGIIRNGTYTIPEYK